MADDVNPASPRPTFALAGGGKGQPIGLEQMLALYWALTGRGADARGGRAGSDQAGGQAGQARA